MAIFNPDAGDVPSPNMPDQTGASRGTIPNRSFESLFQGIGTAIEGVTSLADQAIQESIKIDTRMGFDKEMKPFTDTVPVELSNGAASLKSLQTAMEQGKISDVYFYGQLTALSKSMRAKYPGYESFVDSAIQNITGVRPANAYRDAIIGEFEKQQREMQADEDKWDVWLKQNEAIVGQLFPDYFQDPSKYGRDEVRQAVVTKKADLAGIEQTNSEIQLLINQGKLTDERAAESASVTLSQSVNTFMTGTSNALGFNGTNFMKKVIDANAAGFSPEEYSQIVGELSGAETALRYSLQQQINTPLTPGSTDTYASILGTKGANELVEESMAPFLAIKEMIVNKEYGMAGYYTRLNSIGSQRDINTIINAFPEARAAMALREIDPALATVFLTESGAQEGLFKDIVPELTARTITGVDTFDAQVERIVGSQQPDVEKASGLNALIDTHLAAITSGALAPEEMSKTVEAIYGLMEDGRSVFTYVNPNERQKLYIRMFNPEVTSNIIATGNRQDLMKYYTAARDQINGIPEFRKAAAAITGIPEWTDKLDVSFNPTSGSIVVQQTGQPDNIFTTEAYNFRHKLPVIQSGVSALNNVLSTLNPMLEGLGVDEAMKPQLYQEVLNDLNIEFDAGKKDGFFEWLSNEIGGMLGQLDDKTQEYQMTNNVDFDLSGYQKSAGPGAGFESYFKKARSAESGGNDSAANPNSSASGRYQFIDSTWKTYAKRLGLTDKTDPEQQEIAMRAFTKDNADALSSAGIILNDGNLYAAHFLGAEDAIEVLNAPDDTPLSDYVAPRVIRANKFLTGMTVGDFKRWSQTKMS